MRITIQHNLKRKELSDNPNGLKKLFNKLVVKTKELQDQKFLWVSDSEVIIDQIPPETLHNFLITAEKLGKKVEFKRVTQTIISIK